MVLYKKMLDNYDEIHNQADMKNTSAIEGRMKKLLLFCSMLSFMGNSVQAGFELNDDNISGRKAVFSLSDGIVQEGQDDNKKENVEEEEDKGFFSFIDFSFLKKNKPKVKALPNEQKESFIQRVTREAEEGNVDAQLSLGYMYLYGEDGVKMDYAKAFTYYNMAASQGDNIAINNLGSLYFSGIGTERNLTKAAQLFEKAAKLGNTEASINLAFIYLTKNSSLNNPREAIQLLKSASEQGNPTAKYMLGYAYYRGFVVEQDFKKAVVLIRDAANAKYADAEYLLGYMYLNGHGIAKNYGNAVKYFTKASNQGNVDAMVTLGNMLAGGVMYTQDMYRAHVLFNIASTYGIEVAAQKRDLLEKKLKIEEFLQAQAEAEKFKEQQSEITAYVRQTYGNNIRHYIDENMSFMLNQNQ